MKKTFTKTILALFILTGLVANTTITYGFNLNTIYKDNNTKKLNGVDLSLQKGIEQWKSMDSGFLSLSEDSKNDIYNGDNKFYELIVKTRALTDKLHDVNTIHRADKLSKKLNSILSKYDQNQNVDNILKVAKENYNILKQVKIDDIENIKKMEDKYTALIKDKYSNLIKKKFNTKEKRKKLLDKISFIEDKINNKYNSDVFKQYSNKDQRILAILYSFENVISEMYVMDTFNDLIIE